MAARDVSGLGLPPLPRATADAVGGAMGDRTVPAGANVSLVWERYPRIWSGYDLPKSQGTQAFLREFVRGFGDQRTHQEPALKAWHRRMATLGEGRGFVSFEPLATGLGSSHPSENGFTFDRALGVPVLSGAGLKGLTRAGAKLLGASDAEIRRLLGSEPPAYGARGGEPLTPGRVVFLGGWPSAWPNLRVDLIAPHHPVYQDDQNQHPPRRAEGGDGRRRLASYAEEPVPVAFLTVAPGATFQIYLGLTARGAPGDLTTVWGWLALGLELLGFGGKTGSGFGRMRPVGAKPWAPAAPEPAARSAADAVPADRTLVIFEAMIGTAAPKIDEKAAAEGAGGVVRTVVWNRSGQALPAWTTKGPQLRARLADLATRLRRDADGPVVVAALAEMPVLVALGAALAGPTPVDPLLARRRGAVWGWAEPEPDDAPVTLQRPEDPDGAPALLINISGRNLASDLPKRPDGRPWAVYEITVPEPRVDLIRSRPQLDDFVAAVRTVIGLAQPALRRDEALAVFPAMPAAFAVALGLCLDVRASPPLEVYDRPPGTPRWVGPLRVERPQGG